MTPSTSWLFPRPHALPGEEAAFWPDTGFTVVPEPPCQGRQLSDMQDDDEIVSAEVLEYAALVGHEQTHWIQANAFGYGRFLSRLDHARSEIAESFIGLLSSDEVERLTSNRLQGQPMLKLAPSQRILKRKEFGPIGARVQRHWWSLGLLRHELEESDRTLGGLQSSAFRYGLAVLYAEAGPHVSRVAMMPDGPLKEMAMERAPTGNYGRALARCAYTQLSSVAIAECCAVLDQHWGYAHATQSLRRHGDAETADRLHRTHVASWESKEVTLYGDAFRAFAYFNPHLDLNAPRPLLTLGICGCLALDGNYAPEVRGGRPTWLDLSPPLRFLRLVRAVRRVGVVPANVLCDLSPGKTHAYCEKLLDAAGLSQPAHLRLPRLPPHVADFSPIGWLRRLSHDAHVASVRLRRHMPAALLAPSETAMYRHEELNNGPLAAYNLARLPPLMSVGGRSVAIGIDLMRFAQCAAAGAYQRLLWQLVGDTAPFSFAGLPTDSAGLAATKYALKILRERTERPVVFEF